MTTEVKICGLRDDAALEAALAAGADYVGFVFYDRSPRNVAPDTARALVDKARGKAKSVALLVNPDDVLIESILARVDPDILQLHGEEAPERVGEIVRRFGKPVMKAVAVADARDVQAALDYAAVGARILFDAKPPPRMPGDPEVLPGGNGISFNWQALAGLEGRLDYMLAGGLKPENVAEAVRLTGAPAVDVSSGVEVRPGEKDPDLIRRFISAAKTAKDNPSPREWENVKDR